MIPRLKTSKKWTSLPSELCTQIREVYAESFSSEAKAGQFIVEGRIYAEELILRAGYLENGRLRQINVEVSMDFDVNKQNALELIHFTVDCAASMLQEVFHSDEEIELESFPAEWKSFTIDQKTVFIQVTTVNSKLESDADRILREAKEESLVQGDELIDDAESEAAKEKIITMLGLAEGEDFPTDEDDGSSGKGKKVH